MIYLRPDKGKTAKNNGKKQSGRNKMFAFRRDIRGNVLFNLSARANRANVASGDNNRNPARGRALPNPSNPPCPYP
jgi:hypothetical protein